ncbi:MAG: amidohydrolase family protein, partial [Candidatus Nanopelagicales bacterium]
MSLPIIDRLGIPGIVDVHSHFMPHAVMTKVWEFFDNAEEAYGLPWPVEYRGSDERRIEQLEEFGVVAFTSLAYAHKPGMAAWLNDWCASFARATPRCLQTATFFPEPGVADYVASAIDSGARVFKVHLQVGAFDPRDPLLVPVWDLLAQSGVPAVVHCGSGPLPGRFTGPGPIGEVIARHPDLQVIVAHMGAPEYTEFLAMARANANVRLDTTMAFTDFMNDLAEFPPALLPDLYEAGLRGDILFGSDFPNIPYPYADAVTALERLDLGDEWLRTVLYTT